MSKPRAYRFYVEHEPGLLVRRDLVGACADKVEAESPEVRGHYDRMFGAVELAQRLRQQRFRRVLAIGGGHPRFESYLNAGEIVVADPAARLYESHLAGFSRIFPECPPITYLEMDAETALSDPPDDIDCITFVHVLEHLPVGLLRAVLRRALSLPVHVIIYSPNADVCRSNDWFHLEPVHEHLAIFGCRWLLREIHANGVQTALPDIAAYSDDLLCHVPHPRRRIGEGA